MPVDPQLAEVLERAAPVAEDGETPQQARERFSYFGPYVPAAQHSVDEVCALFRAALDDGR